MHRDCRLSACLLAVEVSDKLVICLGSTLNLPALPACAASLVCLPVLPAVEVSDKLVICLASTLNLDGTPSSTAFDAVGA